MQSRLSSAKVLSNDLEKQIRILELSPRAPNPSLLDAAAAGVERLRSEIDQLDKLLNHEPSAQRAILKRRLDSLFDECDTLTASVNKLRDADFMRRREEHQRNELLGSYNRVRSNNGVELLVNESGSLKRSERGLQELLDRGAAMFTVLHHQGESIKNVHRKIIDVANVLGLSENTIRAIERRLVTDRWIVYGGMFLTSIVLLWVLRAAGKLTLGKLF
eukprot:c5911_g1_i1.p1 GENE.c5911_g1_i1~~c5911_g1_i1.p1  ORF type:complete len:218 (+),score=52.19 c5911_g1_i1:30-683(+)